MFYGYLIKSKLTFHYIFYAYCVFLYVADEVSKNLPKQKCTVAFVKTCVPHNECLNICRSMGSSSSRWLSNGCCECLGLNCENHQIKNKRYVKCHLHYIYCFCHLTVLFIFLARNYIYSFYRCLRCSLNKVNGFVR